MLKKINHWLESHEATTLYKMIPFISIMATFLCAAYGMAQLVDDKGIPLYKSYQWFYGAFGFLGGNGPINELSKFFSLQLAAFLAPISVISTLVYIFAKRLRSWYFFTFQKRDHIVVCGLGLNNRYYIDSELEAENCPKIVVIEKDKTNPYIEKYENKGVFFLFGDATNEYLLKESGVKTCEHIMVSTGFDISNLNVSKVLKKIEVKNKAYVHIDQRDLKIFMNESMFYGEYFSYYENACRDLFINKKLLLNGVDTIDSNESVKLLIIGFGQLGHEVALNALKLGSFYNKQKIEITIVDNDSKSFDKFLSIYPAATEIGRLHFELLEIKSPAFVDKIIKAFDFTYVVVALGDDNLTLTLLASLNFHLKQHHFLEEKPDDSLPPIAVRFCEANEIEISDISPSMFKFGITSEMCHRKNIVKHELDSYAIALYEHYKLLEKLKKLKWSSGLKKLTLEDFQYQFNEFFKKSNDEWGRLPNFDKDSNRAAVDHYFVVKKQILERKKINLEAIDADEKQKLIDIEHTRWANLHLLHGWKHKEASIWSQESDKKTKKSYQEHHVHPCLVETDKLRVLGKSHNDDYEKNDFDIYKILVKMEKKMKLPITPLLAVDGIIEVYDEKNNFEGIVLIERKNRLMGLALPGGFVDVGESVEDALKREMKEETMLDVYDLKLLNVFSDPKRDPRFHVASIVFTCKAKGEPKGADDAKVASIYEVQKIPFKKLVFDHKLILEYWECAKINSSI